MESYSQVPSPHNPRPSTNESVTSIEEEPSSRSLSNRAQQIRYRNDKNVLEIQSQITDPKLFSYILTHPEPTLAQSIQEPEHTVKQPNEAHTKGKKMPVLDIGERENYSIENIGRSSRESFSSRDDAKFMFDVATPKECSELETLNAKLTEHNKKYQTENEFLKNELAKAKAQLENAEGDKQRMATQINELKEERVLSLNKVEVQEQLNEIEGKLKTVEKEKQKLALTLEEQKELIIKREVELIDANKQISDLSSELQYLKEHCESQQNNIISLKSDLNSCKAKILRLEMDNKELQLKSNTEEASEKMWEKIAQCDQMLRELTRENEEQKHFIGKQGEQLHHVSESLTRKKAAAKKYKSKVKELKKERDLLKIEVLKIKQSYSDKCDNYKEAKNKLEKKLKEKKQALASLEALMAENMNNTHKKSMFDWRNSNDKEIEHESHLKPKSLENTYKYHFNDLSATLQANEMRRKMDLISMDEQVQKTKNHRRDFENTCKVPLPHH
eukprot:TRINITY_DN8518_c0_g1_i10.p1 TRINITY_DN8518_c0_g1~~TRINITY_DN8518_c0_g1_i10.p1  ORF type:complete len:502 (+),score=129.56 TRINITY_DN8518_c0_g1_i10:102-1607(+)